MKFAIRFTPVLFLLLYLSTQNSRAEESFSTLVGPVSVGSVKGGRTLEIPYITWGGDVAAFHANGGLTTASGSTFDKLGLGLKFVKGDDFPGQVRRYMSGDSPFLRGEFRMLGLASEVIGSDPRTKAVVFLQLTWSAGDHMVGRPGVKTLAELKGRKVALQKGGPHVGMLDDILHTAKLSWSDITPVWTADLTGDKGPAAAFRKDASVDACFVISPDMIGLTGGLDSKGTGAEGTVKEARVVVSTAQMSRSLADVWACRKDFFDANKPLIEKFVAGYLKGCEELTRYRRDYQSKGSSEPYIKILKMAQSVFGADVIPTLDVDAHGLLMDCTFVGLPGNVSFFTDKGNLNGFDAKQQASLDLAVGQGYAKVRSGFFPPSLDYDNVAKLGGLTYTKASEAPRIAEGVDVFPDGVLDERTIYSFSINFEPNQNTFSATVYGQEFQRVVESASTFGNAVIAIRGHSDPTKTLVDLVKAGMTKGVLQRSGTSGNYQYYYNKKPLDLAQPEQIMKLVETGAFDGVAEANPRDTMQAALNLSQARAQAVRDAIVGYAKGKGFTLDPSQIKPAGVGIAEPLIAKPKDMDEARKNMRVEFRLIKVPAEVVKQKDFDF